MSLLPNAIDISEDSRRQCGQNIEGEKRGHKSDDETLSVKRRKLSGQSTEEEENDSPQEVTVEDWLSYMMPSPPNNINDLCPEVFQIIISKYLKSNNWRKLVPLRLVCKYWRSNIDAYLSSRHGFQYTGRLTKGTPPPVMNYYEFNAMLSFYPNMRQLIVKNFTVSDHLVAILRQNVPKLERLSLYGCRNLSWKGLTILAVRFPQLKFIDVSNCELDENRLSILVENLQNLKIMNAINPGREVTGQCLSKLGPHIQDIWIGLNHMSNCNSALRALVSGNGKNLLHLGLIVNNYQTTEWSIITENMRQLKSLKLTFGSFRASSLKEFAKLKNLEFLVLAEDSRNEKESVLTDESLMPVLRGCSQLKSLAIAGTKANTLRFTNRSIGQIPRLCPHMEQIRFLNAHNIDDNCLTQLASIPSLLVLHLSSMNGITDAGIKAFAKESKRVRNFRVSDCPNVTEDIIDVWIEVANNRSDERIKLFLESMNITKSLENLPPNLKIEVKAKAEGEAPPKANTLMDQTSNAANV